MDLKSVHEIFTNRIFLIPSYQRGYSWSNNKALESVEKNDLKNVNGQLMDIWNDINNIPDDGWHYTGLLTLVEMQSQYDWMPNHKQYAIVDGQQRITTILILIAVILEIAEKRKYQLGARKDDERYQYLYAQNGDLKTYIFGYDKDNPSDKYYRRHILNLDEIEDDSEESVYTENLRKAKLFFIHVVLAKINEGNDQDFQLKKLFSLVTSGLRMNEYILPKELNQYVVFETTNNRGKALSELEKLKNRLMYLVDKIRFDDPKVEKAEKKGLENQINTAWITIYKALGAKKDSPLDDEDFLKNHWIAYFNSYNRKKAKVYANYLFKEHFTIEKIYQDQLKVNDIMAYVKSLQKCAIIWKNICYPEFFSSTATKSVLQSLHRVGFFAPFKPMVLAVLCFENNADYLEIIKLLERYALKIFHVSGQRSNTGNTELYKLASEVFHSKIKSCDACEKINKEISKHYRFQDYKDLMSKLFEVDKKQGFYSWAGLRYFLFEYDYKLRRDNNTSTCSSEIRWAEFSQKDFNQKKTIEHIYPQSAAKNCNVLPEHQAVYDSLKKDWETFSSFSDEERMRLCHSLGNLLPISHSDNASFSNDKFTHKVDQSNKGNEYKDRGYRFDSMSAQVVARETDWTPESIKNRGLSMLDYLLELLGEKSDIMSENEKINLLGLGFLINKDITSTKQ